MPPARRAGGALRVQRVGTTRTLAEQSAGGGVVRRTVLPGGLRVVTEAVPGVRSVAVGIWVGVGSRDETPSLAGASHYLEHLLFKGTRSRSALDISVAIDAVGGEINAFTSKEYTCFYARVLDTDLALAIDVVSDLVTSSVVSSADVEAERSVILEEIAMHDDDPADAAHEVFTAAVFGDTPLGRPVLGSVDSIESLSRQAIAGYYRRRYRPESMVVSVAGGIDHATVVRLVRKAFSRSGLLESGALPAPARLGATKPLRPVAPVRVVHRPTEQANVVLGVGGVARTDPRRFALGVLNAALGGGMSSRLFQEVREKRGLAYSVYSYTAQYADAGTFSVYAGCQPKKVDDVLAICREQLALVAERGLTEEELRRGQGQLRGGLVLGLEDTGSRMSRLGKAELVYGELLGVDELLAQIDAVTLDDVQAVAGQLLGARPVVAVVGPFGEDRDFGAAVA
ncbi:putative Zn-dependent peptidase [Motilibacter rhizosphaerae]|uniref:Putative Zn-dependent peptidase n=1 Tax=Motilibacter rhizosphaerae TaxID=598652 RepID=A0A4Q7NPP9_9ACTN|nr:pitrilysin family protein [Motilibacter rhizosphaerae]RZS86946.1 putative Zn-dependent peptidase [Motilibacter rhizosphaerae]